MRSRFVLAVAVAICLFFSVRSDAHDGTNVLVVANEAVPGSVQIGEEYQAARAIPKDQLLRLKIVAGEELSPEEFERQIQSPIAEWIVAHGLQDRILYIVLTKGVPLRITGTDGRQGTRASVDSELALLYRRLTGVPVAVSGPVANPYYAANVEDIKSLKPFSRATHDIYLVTRLDGFTIADALALIQRGLSPSKEGRIVLDTPLATRDTRFDWIERTAARLGSAGFTERVVVETTGRAVQNETGVLGYVSWGSNDPALNVRHPGLTFVPGALASMFLSNDARTFVEPPADWKPSAVLLRNAYAGSSQTLIADLIRSGVTGAAGHVNEPYLDGAVRPDILFPAYLSGFNLAESFYLALPSLSWQTVIVGDPLCAPFRTTALGTAEPEPPLDSETELPARFAARRLAALERLGTPAMLKLVLLGQGRMARADEAGAVDALKRAVALDPSSPIALRALAEVYERAHRYVEAASTYQALLRAEPNDVTALNNLAYNLAVRQNQAREAYPLAARAAALGRGNPTIEDTLGWIQHLLGDDASALVLLERASRALLHNADVQFHAAVVYAKAERLDDAARALVRAGELDPTMKEQPEYRELQRRLGGKR